MAVSVADAPLPSSDITPPRRSHMDALTGMRALAALNIVFFHFSNPKWFGPFAPVVDNGYVSVSFFLLLSGFVLAYNYQGRADRGEMRARTFWLARFSRIYPAFLFSLLVSLGMLMEEWHARTHGQFLAGIALTPLLLQGWSPQLCTFWNTPAWTLTTDVLFYALFPWLITLKRPRTRRAIVLAMLMWWVVSFILPALYTIFHPDGELHIDRYSNGLWLRALKFGPLQHVPSFLFGMGLASINDFLPERSRARLALGLVGFSGLYIVLFYGSQMPYVFMHDGLLMPLYAMIILGLAGQNFLARLFSIAPLLAVGEASYCLYILHFNLWLLIHNSKVLERTGLARFDPWLSYALLVIVALAALRWVERPGQRWIKRRFRFEPQVQVPTATP
ncbi:MAG: acyltransferase family protein [Acidobacteriaceae bacterium]